jgi:Uma2 family endonuclease
MSSTATAPAHPLAASPISIEEYLRTSYHPDVDYVDGFLEDRTVGEFEHGRLRMLLGMWFESHRAEWKVLVTSEFRNRVSSTQVRIPDVCLVPEDGPREKVRVTPPILCIEIRSPEDLLSRILTVFDDCLAMGVPNIWLLDPIERTAFTYDKGGLRAVSTPHLSIQNSPIYIDLPALFAAIG